MKKTKNKKVSEKANVKRIQNQHLSRGVRGKMSLEIVKSCWIESLKRLVQLVKNKDTGEYFHEIRGMGLYSSTLDKPTKDLDKAVEQFENFSREARRVKLKVIDNFYPEAKRFILKYQEEGARGDYSRFAFKNKLSFILAVSELLAEGFVSKNSNGKVTRSFIGIQCNRNRDYHNRNKSLNRLILKRMNDIEVSEDNLDFKKEFRENIKNLIANKLTEATFTAYFYRILNAIQLVFLEYPRVFKGLNSVESEMKSVYKAITINEKATSLHPDGNILNDGHFDWIPIKELERILDIAFENSIPIYNFLILSLSCMMRPSEMRRLVAFRDQGLKDYIIDGSFLNYKYGKLVTKTEAEVDPTSLDNPALSIISRVLLKYPHKLQGKGLTIKEFFEIDGVLRKNKGLENYTERCLRITGGHMLAFCIRAQEPHRSDTYEVKSRMGHASTEQAIKVYAATAPSQSQKPEVYFDNIGSGITKDGELITSGQPLWDAYLLRHWIVRMSRVHSESNMKIIWNQIMEEYRSNKQLAESMPKYKPSSF